MTLPPRAAVLVGEKDKDVLLIGDEGVKKELEPW